MNKSMLIAIYNIIKQLKYTFKQITVMLKQEYVWRLHIEFITMLSLVCSHQHEKKEEKAVMFVEIRKTSHYIHVDCR